MFHYILRRLLIAVPVIFGISVIVFALVHLQPGDPYVAMIDPMTSPEEKQRLLARLGYYDPIWVKYLRWIGRAAVGDFGYSIQYGAPVTQVIASRIGNTALLAGTALGLTLLVSVPVGVWAGLRRDGRADVALSVVSFVIVSIPAFFLAMLLIKIFAADLRWLPTGGVVTVGAGYRGLDHLRDVAVHLILPASVLAIGNAAIMSRYLRGAVADIADQDFVRTLFAKGLTRRQVIFPHLLRNGAKPLITMISLEIPSLFSAALLTETIFNWPGIGRLNFEAVQNRDYALLMGIILMLALVTVVVNLLADLLYALVDPRVRLGS
ncbi:ABC transporter permease [Ketogulonicigenium vulgare]|uniref:ABC-type dipeptide/oligopeptide/nickel transport system, permease component n=1 Tax=Ketogulonicigenium vulgare (strain WSH-001) TaxID=759362 RepID=F9Y8S2_KETVW|nr:ABC transporter permease [Ketogulonicigenium vulgare]AEM41241.1 ABC-type dipeptide/oligopeptide/nickel transport system, permease component [Ketogulonicigenium vulgare WSH-001]ALJ81382.1 peptide permease [Ketogulonicigenium vulgare]ANW34110.1 peptide permease [Ketogulonicigenium vulgare]